VIFVPALLGCLNAPTSLSPTESFEILCKELQQNEYLEDNEGFRIQANSMPGGGWSYHVVILPETPDLEIYVIVDASGKVRILQ
jgi:hypothetical protein